MPYTKKQQAAARAEYGRRKKGIKSGHAGKMMFKGMSLAQLKKWASAKKLEKKKKKKKGNPHPKKGKKC